ncbi:MAG: anhydro-N-acetylmuramic acid kinase [Cyclobacteriaceae bacterium]|jgi:anhydro-N-acetylmuramic acid kinase
MNKTYRGIGMMSGTSLDGLDIVYANFWQENLKWKYQILKTNFQEYPEGLYDQLKHAKHLSSEKLMLLDVIYGKWIGEKAHDFINNKNVNPDFIASHGYTVFHQPEHSMTLQIGSGNEIFAKCKMPVVYNFRQLDVALGGQGAPLVPIGDRLLFGEYDYCLNLGGIANISTEHSAERIAFDIAPANLILNYFAQQLGEPFDRNGKFASQGTIISELLNRLESLDFYKKNYPKSLGSEWVEENILSLDDLNSHDPMDLLATLVDHIASRIVDDVCFLNREKKSASSKMLVTGGGAKNGYLIESIKNKLAGSVELIVPNEELVDFKEALIFAFLGVLRLKNVPNCVSSVTGATRDSSGGIIISEHSVIY